MYCDSILVVVHGLRLVHCRYREKECEDGSWGTIDLACFGQSGPFVWKEEDWP